MKTEDRFSEDRRIKSLAKKLAKGAWPKLDEMARQSFLAKAKITICSAVRAHGSLAASWFGLPGFEPRRDPDADPYDKSGNVKR